MQKILEKEIKEKEKLKTKRDFLMAWIRDLLSHIENPSSPLPSPPSFLQPNEEEREKIKQIQRHTSTLSEKFFHQEEDLKLQNDTIDELTNEKDGRERLRDATMQIFLLEDQNEILNITLELFGLILNFDSGAIYAKDPVSNLWKPIYKKNEDEIFEKEIAKQIEAGIFDWVIQSKKTMTLPADESEENKSSLIFTPMPVGERTIGIICIRADFLPDQITPYQSDNLLIVASQAAAAFENANLFSEILSMKKYNESILQNMTSGVMVVSKKGILTSINPVLEELFGIQASDVISFPLSSNPVLKQFESIIKKIFSDETQSVHEEIEIHGEKSGEKILDIKTSCLCDQHNQNTDVILAITDLTQVKTLEKQVSRADRLASLGKVAAGTAHEIRNPLSAIRGTMQLMNRKLKKLEEPKLIQKIESVMEEVDRINRIVGQMMELSKEVKVELKPYSPALVVKDVIAILDGMFHETQTVLNLSLDETAPEINIDTSEIKQVLLNLMQNAVQAMGEKGVLDISVSVLENKQVMIQISDHGPGIPKEYLDKVFEPFFTTKEDGTGLGLSISNRIIKEHEGTMTVESSSEQGTTFTIILPSVKEKKS